MKKVDKILLMVLFSLFSLAPFSCSSSENKQEEKINYTNPEDYPGKKALATFAGGCFWCIEAPFEGIDGVIAVISGYSGGKEKNPTYEEVSNGKTGHREAVQITYDPDIISYSELLDIFWQQFDPTDEGGAFYDRGFQYSSAIFYHDNTQKNEAQKSLTKLEEAKVFDKPIVTPIIKYSNFYPAEEYHQDYYLKNPSEYYAYRRGSGRDAFIAKHWPVDLEKKYTKPSDAELKKRLTKLQYDVTMHEATERAFANKYNDNKETGIYVCIVSGAPLFSSKDKYESYSGWPSFVKPIDARLIDKPTDSSYGMVRVEVRSKLGDSHLGHVFNDGPDPTNLRYCMNSAAMRFIPKKEMEKEGYGAWLWLLD
ncbi:peptide-methionine (R)-S-oxide reductase MsrB [Cecembia lonarensis]|uniref:Multifunctional fusion protein n=1 Tax=Cecembia lonarensis (strain CCUG 58316 / KCTC 22772 / LW9) TaxID=1225176 RepID=K1LBP6_CECL9|nr:peptide-methionine (R)-S-oxide reductase MsrB [Cecembia lonarensis]EKB47743.1 Peptide methionine sulfoxide reductase MsrA/MsrB [Cecembia lonarensis LW9]